MNQDQTEEEGMPVDQIPIHVNQAQFTAIPREGLFNRYNHMHGHDLDWWE